MFVRKIKPFLALTSGVTTLAKVQIKNLILTWRSNSRLGTKKN